MCKDEIPLHVCIKLCKYPFQDDFLTSHFSLSILTSSFKSFSFRYFSFHFLYFYHYKVHTRMYFKWSTTRRYSLVKWRVRPLYEKLERNVFTRSLLLKNLYSPWLLVYDWINKLTSWPPAKLVTTWLQQHVCQFDTLCMCSTQSEG